MIKKQILFSLISVATIAGCGGGGGGGSSSAPSASVGRDTNDINVYSSSEVMDFSRANMKGTPLCANTKSKFATDDFIIGSNDNVSDERLKATIAATQKAFNLHIAAMGLTDSDLDLENGEKLEICIATSEGSNGAGNMGGIIVGTGRTGAKLDLLLDHELVHTIGDRVTGNASITAYSHRWFDEGIAEMFSGDGTLTQSQMMELLAPDNKGNMRNPAEVENKGAEDIWLFAGRNANYWYPAYNTTLHYLMSEGLKKVDIVSVYKNYRVIHDACEANMVAVYNDTGKGVNINNKVNDPYDPTAYYPGRIACFGKSEVENPVQDALHAVYPGIDLTGYLTLDPFGSGQYVHQQNIFELALNSVIKDTNVISYSNLQNNYDSLVTNGYLQ